MKKKICLLLVWAVLFSCAGFYAYAAPEQDAFALVPVSVIVNDEKLDANILLYDSAIHVPLRDICSAFNSNIRFDAEKNTIDILTGEGPAVRNPREILELGGREMIVSATKASYRILLDGIDTYMTSFTYDEVTYVPLYYMAEFFGKYLYTGEDDNKVYVKDLPRKEVGVVNGESVYIDEIDYYLRQEINRRGYDFVIDAALKNEMQSQIFEYVVQRKLVLQKAKEANITLAAEDKEAVNATILKNVNAMSGIKGMQSALYSLGANFSTYTDIVKEDALIGKLFDRQYERPEIAEDRMRQYYEENINAFTVQETVKAKHILLFKRDLATGEEYSAYKRGEARMKAQELLKKIRAGADFDTLMRENSQDPGSKEKPEGYTFTRGEMVKEFEDAAFALQPGEVSDVVESVYGYHIITVVERSPEKVFTFDEARPDIQKTLENAERDRWLNNLIKAWKADSRIENKLKQP